MRAYLFLFLGATLLLANCQKQSHEQADAIAPTDQTNENAAPVTKLNVNTATKEQMLAIPNVGDRMVREFEEYRPYSSITQFRREIGKYVDDDQVAAYEEYLFVPIDPNGADVPTLMQIPGVTTAAAQALVNARPYDSSIEFLTALGQHISVDDSGIASSYISHGY